MQAAQTGLDFLTSLKNGEVPRHLWHKPYLCSLSKHQKAK